MFTSRKCSVQRPRGKSRTTFKECGHRGFGKFCHRCKQAEVLLIEIDAMKGGPEQTALINQRTHLLSPSK